MQYIEKFFAVKLCDISVVMCLEEDQSEDPPGTKLEKNILLFIM